MRLRSTKIVHFSLNVVVQADIRKGPWLILTTVTDAEHNKWLLWSNWRYCGLTLQYYSTIFYKCRRSSSKKVLFTDLIHKKCVLRPNSRCNEQTICTYSMSKKSCPFLLLYSQYKIDIFENLNNKLLYVMGHDFFDKQ